MKTLKTIVATAAIVFAATTVATAGVHNVTEENGSAATHTAATPAQPPDQSAKVTYTIALTAKDLARLAELLGGHLQKASKVPDVKANATRSATRTQTGTRTQTSTHNGTYRCPCGHCNHSYTQCHSGYCNDCRDCVWNRSTTGSSGGAEHNGGASASGGSTWHAGEHAVDHGGGGCR